MVENLTPRANKGGRPKGSRDKKPRYRSNMAIVPKTIIDIARREIAALGPEGRTVDKVGCLRSAQVALVGVILKEIGQVGDDAIARRASLRDAFNVIHAAEIEALRIAPQEARGLKQPDLASIEPYGRGVPIKLDDWKKREPSDIPPGGFK